MPTDNFQDANLRATGNLFTISNGCQFLHRALERILHLTLARTSLGNTQIDISNLSDTIFQLEGTIMLQTAHLLIDKAEHGNESTSYEQSHKAQQYVILDISREANTTPSYTKQEIDNITDGEELQRATRVQRVAIGVTTKVEISITGIGITDTNEGHYHLNEENR